MKPFIFCLIPVLWFLGGWKKAHWRGYRIVLIPLILGAFIPFLIPATWLTRLLHFLIITACFQTVRLGYGNYSPEDDPKPSFLAQITHDRGGWWIRAIYALIVAGTGGFALFMCHYIGICLFLGYVAFNVVLDFLVVRLRFKVLLCDLLIGAGFASILFALR